MNFLFVYLLYEYLFIYLLVHLLISPCRVLHQNHYEVLGLKKDCTATEVKDQFISLSKEVGVASVMDVFLFKLLHHIMNTLTKEVLHCLQNTFPSACLIQHFLMRIIDPFYFSFIQTQTQSPLNPTSDSLQ